MKPFKVIPRIILTLLLGAALLLAHTWWFKPLRLDWFYTRVFLQQLLDSPMMLTDLQLLDKTGLAWYGGQLGDFSIEHEEQRHARLNTQMAQFAQYDPSGLTGQDRISWQIADATFRLDQQAHIWRWHEYPVNQLFGMQSALPNFLMTVHPIENEGNVRDYLSRMRAIPGAFDQILEGMRVREAKGLLPNKFSVDKTLVQMRAFIAPAAGQHALVKSLQSRMEALPPDAIAAPRQRELLAQAEHIVEQSIYPAYSKLIAHLEALARRPLTNDGVWRLPQGDAYYAFAVRKHTTSSKTPEELHQLGLQEVARIGQEIDRILAAQKLPGSSRADKLHALAQRSDQRYPDSDDGREAILQDYQAIINDINQGTAAAFNLRPKAGVEVRRVPEFSEKTSPQGYYQPPSLDGSRPGVFFTNLQKIESTPKFGMRTLAYHEAIPGHHFQIALQMRMEDLPYFRRAGGFTAYVEGWGLYAEHLAWEMGYQKDPLSNLGRLQAEMFRAVRLVVDTGMHAKRWSRERAIEYMTRETGMQDNEVVIEIERYLTDPGQALAYKTGMMKILELREWAKGQLGARFELAQFHDVVLGNGAVPLDVLETIVKQWVADKLAQS